MGTPNGFIMLHRRLLDNPIVCKDADHLAVWVWLLLKAAWIESDVSFGNERITLQPGQLPPISRKTIASELQISESKVQRILKSFENEHQIEQQMGNHSRLISICSWDKYQAVEQQFKPQVNTKRTPTEHQSEHNINNTNNINNINNHSSIGRTQNMTAEEKEDFLARARARFNKTIYQE